MTFPLFFRSLDLSSSGFLEFNEFMMLMCDLYEKKSSVLYQNIFDQFHQSHFFRQLCQDGPIMMPKRPKKRILYRGKSGQVSDDEDGINNNPILEDGLTTNHRKVLSFKGKRNQRKDQYVQNSDSPPTISATALSSRASNSWFDRFNCFRKNAKIAALQSRILELTAINKPSGPHGRYCLCGCRSHLQR